MHYYLLISQHEQFPDLRVAKSHVRHLFEERTPKSLTKDRAFAMYDKMNDDYKKQHHLTRKNLDLLCELFERRRKSSPTN